MNLSSLIHFVLVRPQFAGNTGSVARALKNTGFKNLVLVQPAFEKSDPDLLKMAVGAKTIAQRAPVFENLKEALASYPLVLGTSRRRGAYRKNMMSLWELSGFIEKIKSGGKMALLFGTEADGLANEELELCQHLIYIPSHPKFESFNLAQAVLLVAYELFRSRPRPAKKSALRYPSTQELEGMYEHLTQMLLEVGFMRKTNPHHMPRILRNIFNRAQLTDPEVRVIRGICRQVLWYKKSREVPSLKPV